MRLIFFSFKHRYRQKELNNFLNTRIYGKYFILNLGGPFKHFIAKILLFLRIGKAISCDGRPIISDKSKGINFWMRGTTLNIPNDVNSILEVWENTPRITLVDGVFNTSSTSVKSMPGTAEIMEFSRGLGRDFSDLNEIAVWRDGVHLVDGLLYYYQAIHQESDVIPENIDAIRSMCELEKDNMKSILKTNQALGIN